MPSSKSNRSTSLVPSAFYDDIPSIKQGKARANYGDELIASLSEHLTKEFGKGFGVSTLKDMRQFSLTFPKSPALRGELSWTHYRLLIEEQLLLRKPKR